MALSSTIFTFDIDLADIDRGVFETLSLKVARHPSESDEFLVARVLAFCAEYADGIAFSRGLCEADEPAIAVRDLTGALLAWIDIGTPAPERLHRATKLARRVAVYVHKDYRQWLSALRASAIHRPEALTLRTLEPAFIGALVARLQRRTSIAVTIAGAEVSVAFEGESVSGRVGTIVAGTELR